jgi:hypothetical protein
MPFTKDFQLTPYGQRGGITTYPVAGVVSGAKLSLPVDPVDAAELSVVVSAGTVRYDGYPITFSSNITATLTHTETLATGTHVLDIYLNAPRKVTLVTTLPAASGYAAGDFIALGRVQDGQEYGTYGIVEQIYVKRGSVWEKIDPMSGADFPREYGWNNMPYNSLATGDPLVQLYPEMPIFLGSKLPPHTARPLALFRQTASIYLGEVTVAAGVATITKAMPEYHILPI